jgi:hypothetical protein
MSVRDWEREFKDFARGKIFLAIILGTEDDPNVQTNISGLNRPRLIQEYLARNRVAFYSLCQSMKATSTIYISSMMDAFRDEDDPNPSEVYSQIMALLRPNDVDARMLIIQLSQFWY